MNLYKDEHAHMSRSTCAYIKEYMHLYERNTCTYTKGTHALTRKEHMHLHKEVHAFGQEVVMPALRNTQTRQGNRHP